MAGVGVADVSSAIAAASAAFGELVLMVVLLLLPESLAGLYTIRNERFQRRLYEAFERWVWASKSLL
jgi:hypothetical protein